MHANVAQETKTMCALCVWWSSSSSSGLLAIALERCTYNLRFLIPTFQEGIVAALGESWRDDRGVMTVKSA
jgi:hypothetical protein